MKCKESYIGTKKECIQFLNTNLPKLFRGELQLEGQDVFIPSREELEFKMKFEYDEDYEYGCVGIKISWGDEPDLPDEEDEEEDDDDDDDDDEEFIPNKNTKDYYL
ncbi:transcription initiation factor IIE [Vallitalea guaymasensis]|uniref:transcription initiation factor IIE n=1 Tax=Vallitalea guaymasensis TaxID=1185412 RepID=UPI00187D39E5|nr:transcription initiation factor IIE [Vallitalea guaymasensis]